MNLEEIKDLIKLVLKSKEKVFAFPSKAANLSP